MNVHIFLKAIATVALASALGISNAAEPNVAEPDAAETGDKSQQTELDARKTHGKTQEKIAMSEKAKDEKKSPVRPEIGANFNKRPENIDFPTLALSKARWVRSTINIFWYFNGERDLDHEGITNLIEARGKGYKVISGLRFDFLTEKIRIPKPGSVREEEYFLFVDKLLDTLGPSLDILVTGNEPLQNTMNEDEKYDSALGGIPLVVFHERLAHRIKDYISNKPEMKGLRIYVGALCRVYEKRVQKNKAILGLIDLVDKLDFVEGLDLHIHVRNIDDIEAALKFARTRTQKPIIVTEFSLMRLYKSKLNEKLGTSSAGREFAVKYGHDPEMKIHQWVQKTMRELVSAEEWNAMLVSREWYPKNYMRDFYQAFSRHNVIIATYNLGGPSTGAKPDASYGPKSKTWLFNPVYKPSEIKPDPQSGYARNPLCYDDWMAIQNPQ